MIIGLFLKEIGIPVVPYIFIMLSVLVQLGGFAFLIYKAKATKSMDTINTAQIEYVSRIAGTVFIIYAAIELIGAFACVAANEACRGLYHRPTGMSCTFCSGKGGHSEASDILMLGIYFDVFMINSYIVAAIETVKNFLDKKKIQLL